ncbi:molybdate ABC transporter substrate-binding protein [Cryobacterium cryoconiti]|uniref:Molybdate ABC transporter substrate-binding protein n=1 Tax=Cryobacterium cryoconiti TaxID=1259239 RepID=A0A4Y8JZY4_9MICO|nr:molybdate ABC transporter substrate-binding protein [Cryobacterium cryoconiti]TFD33230.1 molybdate ABC transporter substrate-binding protein [Cryobacterium cryoconiti]
MSSRFGRMLALGASLLLLAGCATGAAPAAQPDSSDVRTGSVVVTVAAAADLKFALDDIAALAEKDDPSLKVQITYGSSGTFLQQIQNGAPFDIFLSADLTYPQQLVDAGLADEKDLFPYGVGRLVLWVPGGSDLDPGEGLRILVKPEVKRVSVANPEHAPYGKAAVAALQTAGLYDKVAPKLVLGENVAQAAEFVQSGNADAGIVAKSLVLSDPLRQEGTWAELPLDSYPRLDQGGVILGDASQAAGAHTLKDVMLSDSGSEILARYGFSFPGI